MSQFSDLKPNFSAWQSIAYMKIPLENTYVRFNEGDIIGELLAYITLAPVFVMVMYATLIILRRDYSTFFALGGQLFNLLLNKILKKLIDEPRPLDSLDISDSGMPSNHSQFIGYFATFYILQFLFNSKILSIQYRCLYSFFLVILATLVCYSRYYLEYHTIAQVLVGVAIGSSVGVLWSMIDIILGNVIGNYVCSIPLIHSLGVRHFSALEQYLSLRNIKLYKQRKL